MFFSCPIKTWLIRVLAAGSLLIPLPSAAAPAAATEWKISRDFDKKQAPQFAVTATGQAFVGYRDSRGQLILGQTNDPPVILAGASGQPAGLTLATAAERLYAAWLEWRPPGRSTLLLRTSADGGANWKDALVVDDTTRPLPIIEMAGDGDGALHLAWIDSTPDSSAASTAAQRPAQYRLFTRFSADDGQSWGELSELMQGYDQPRSPALVLHQNTAYAFAGAQRDGKQYVVYARSKNHEDWTAASAIKQTGGLLLLEAHTLDNRLLALWFGDHGGHYLLEGAVSEDGQQWHTFEFEDSKNLDIGTIDIASRGREIYVVFSARSARPPAVGAWKRTVYFVRSPDGGATWEKIRTLRHYPFDHTEAHFPKVAATEDGALTVVWNDYRNIRGGLYYNVSKDGGKQWLDYDLPLGAKGKNNDLLFPFVKALQTAGDDYYLLAARYPDDGHVLPELFLHRFTPDTAPASSDLLDDLGSVTKQTLLEKQADTFWQAMIQGDQKTAYWLFDPFFRRRYREIDYLASFGPIQYRSYALKGTQIQGNLARVTVELVYEIPPVTLKTGETFSQPETKTTLQETWLFIEGQWYKEYYNPLGEFSFARY